MEWLQLIYITGIACYPGQYVTRQNPWHIFGLKKNIYLVPGRKLLIKIYLLVQKFWHSPNVDNKKMWYMIQDTLNLPTGFGESSFMFPQGAGVFQLVSGFLTKFVHELLLNQCVCWGKESPGLSALLSCKCHPPTDILPI